MNWLCVLCKVSELQEVCRNVVYFKYSVYTLTKSEVEDGWYNILVNTIIKPCYFQVVLALTLDKWGILISKQKWCK